MKRCIFSISLGCLISSVCLAQDCDNLTGTWKSEAGTTLTISSSDTKSGDLTGTFTSPEKFFSNNGPFSIKGSVGVATESETKAESLSKGTAIAFNIKFPEGGISSWTGTCLNQQDGSSKMALLWHQAHPTASLPISHIKSGSTLFTPDN